MNYRQLALMILNDMTTEQQNATATVFVPENARADEYYPACVVFTAIDCDVLDEGHPIITTQR